MYCIVSYEKNDIKQYNFKHFHFYIFHFTYYMKPETCRIPAVNDLYAMTLSSIAIDY